jgi:hypothetical protein
VTKQLRILDHENLRQGLGIFFWRVLAELLHLPVLFSAASVKLFLCQIEIMFGICILIYIAETYIFSIAKIEIFSINMLLHIIACYIRVYSMNLTYPGTSPAPRN